MADEPVKHNWKTTTVGIATLVGAIAMGIVALLDNDPETTFDMAKILAALAGLGFLAAKDSSN